MWVKAYIRHKTGDLVDCDLLFKHVKIQDSSNKFCKYFIKKSIDKEVHLTYLYIDYFQYVKLQWQLKKYLIQSKDLKLDILKYIVIGLIGYFIAIFQSKNPPSQSPNNNAKTEKTKSKALNVADKKIDSLKLK